MCQRGCKARTVQRQIPQRQLLCSARPARPGFRLTCLEAIQFESVMSDSTSLFSSTGGDVGTASLLRWWTSMCLFFLKLLGTCTRQATRSQVLYRQQHFGTRFHDHWLLCLHFPFAVRHQRIIRKVGLSCVYREFPRRVLMIFSDDGPVVLLFQLSFCTFWWLLRFTSMPCGGLSSYPLWESLSSLVLMEPS